MEVIGAAANIIAVVGLAAKACGVVYKYVDSARGCTATTSQLHKELEAVHKSLERLADVAKRLDAAVQDAAPGKDPSILVTSQLSDTLSECTNTIEDLLKELKGHFSNKFRKSLRKKLKWPLKKPRVMEFINRLSRQQQIFQQALRSDLA
jgi:hypothetical protein